MRIRFLTLLVTIAMVYSARGQTIIAPGDSTTIFKNQQGKVLTKEEAQQLMKDKFSIRQEYEKGKKVITILPDTDASTDRFNIQTEAFRKSLIGQQLTPFSQRDVDNQKWNSKELEGKVVVINFWFTTCKPCLLEMPLLNDLVAGYKDSAVVFIAPAPEDKKQIQKFLSRRQFDYHILPSSIPYIEKLKVENFPTHLVVDRHGTVRQVFIGFAGDIQLKLKYEIDQLLREP